MKVNLLKIQHNIFWIKLQISLGTHSQNNKLPCIITENTIETAQSRDFERALVFAQEIS